jgi:hypothetical protein
LKFMAEMLVIPWLLVCALTAGGSSAWAEQVDGGTFSVSGEEEEESSDTTQSRVYIIQTGDTLWDISSAFWQKAQEWPRMWSYNTYITNPHWIYPGNTILFTPGTLLEPPTMDLEGSDDSGGDGFVVPAKQFETVDAECGPDVRFTDKVPADLYVTPGFLAGRGEVDFKGRIYGAKTGMVSLAEGDLIYIRMEESAAVECGDVLAVVRRGKRVRHPEIRRLRYGRMFEVVAEVRILHTEGGMSTGMIRRSYTEVHRKDRLTTLYPVAVTLPVSKPKGELDGMIVDNLNKLVRLVATGETVFIDRGRADGLRVGDSFYVVHRRDYGKDIHQYDPKLPAQVAGRVVVTRVDEYHATGIVIDASGVIRRGDHLAMSVD